MQTATFNYSGDVMKSTLGRFVSFVGSLAFVALLAGPAFADRQHLPTPVTHAPEIDPTVLGSAAALLVGGALMMGARRARAKR
jgi:hypothetical protein